MNADVEADERRPRTAPADGAGDALARLSLLNMAGARMAGALDMERVARNLVEVALTGFADMAGVYVSEHLIVGDEAPRPVGARSVEARRVAVGAADIDLEAWFPSGEVLVFAPDTPFAECVTEGAVRRFTQFDEPPALDPGGAGQRAARAWLDDLVDFLLVPLKTGDAVLGFVAFMRGSAAGPFTAPQTEVAGELAALAAACLDGARRYQREHATALALQAGLLPRSLDTVPGIQVAHHSVPAGHANLVGGDWCDIIPLNGGRVVVIIGDAMGHGAPAAAAMVQLRAAARTLATLEMNPAEILARLDRIAPGLGPVQFATCACVLLDTAARTGTLCRAGHPPPILLRPDGGCEIVDLPPGLPLGLGDAEYENVRAPIPDGTTLVLYTDGLIESSDRDLEAGVASLRATLTGTETGLDDACAAIVDKLITAPNQDDVTVLLVRATGRSTTTA